MLLTLLLALLGGCHSGQRADSPGRDALADMFDSGRTVAQRLKAVNRAWNESRSGQTEPSLTREQFKKALFLLSVPDPVRVRVTEKLLGETSPDGIADVRNVLRLRLPRETNTRIIGLICTAATDRGWTDFTPALIRSLSRRTLEHDDKRAEYAALVRLNPGVPIEQVVYDTFIAHAEPPSRPSAPGAHGPNLLEERVRTDAWELLGRLDKDGSRRATLLATDPRLASAATDAGSDPLLADLRAAAADLKVVPITGAELEWIRSLRGSTNPDNAAWWAESARAVARLGPEQTAGLQIRNLEPIRFAAVARADWLSMSRPDLLGTLAQRLRGRQTHARTAEGGEGAILPETLDQWEKKLSWGDLLSIMVIDEAIHEPSLVSSLFAQAEQDRKDRTNEHGGAIETVGRAGAESAPQRAVYGARVYTPAAGGVGGDMRYSPTDQLISGTPRALAHYHFHAQDQRNTRFAGPSKGDLEYAATFGRNCVVFTSIREGVLDADFYQRPDVRIDLGELTQPGTK